MSNRKAPDFRGLSLSKHSRRLCHGFRKPEITAEISRRYAGTFRPASLEAGIDSPASLFAVIGIAADTQEQAEHLAMPIRMLLDLRQYHRVSLPTLPSTEEAIAHFGGVVSAEPEDWPKRLAGSFSQVAERLRRMGREAGVDEVMIRPFTIDVEARHSLYRRPAPMLA